MDNLNFFESPPHALRQLIWRQRWKIVATVVLCMSATAAFTALSPLTYRSEAKLFVRAGRESVTLDPMATTRSTANDSRDSELNSIQELLASRLILERVVDQI